MEMITQEYIENAILDTKVGQLQITINDIKEYNENAIGKLSPYVLSDMWNKTSLVVAGVVPICTASQFM